MFQKGNTYGKGRPKGSKSLLPMVRDKIVRVVYRRVFHEKDLNTVSTTDLLKFLATILPKDLELKVAPVNYISNVPREEIEDKVETVVADSNEQPSQAEGSEAVLRSEVHQAVEGL